MTLRHAAALALVGWYLMQPPTIRGKDGKSIFLDHAPLSDWRHITSFDTAKDCEAALNHIYALPTNMAMESGATYNRCVASDDARLKSN